MSEELRGLRSEKQLLVQEGNALKAEKGALVSKLVEAEARVTFLQEDQRKLWSINEALNLEKEKLSEEKLHQQEQLQSEALAAEREKLLQEVTVAQEELLRMRTENASLQVSRATFQALVEELQFSKESLTAACQKDREDKDHLEDCIKELMSENLAVAKDKDETIQKLQSSYEELVRDQKVLVQEIQDLTAKKKSAEEKQSGLENICIALKVEMDGLLQSSRDLQLEKGSLLQDQDKLSASLAAALQVKQLLSAEASGLRAQLDATSKGLRKAELEAMQLQATNNSLTKLLEEIKASREITDSECIQLLHEKEILAMSERRLLAEKEELVHENRLVVEKLSQCSEEAVRVEASLNEKVAYLTSEKEIVCQKASKIKRQLDSLLKEKSVLETQNGDLLAERENSINCIGELKRKYEQESANRRLVVQEKMKLLGNLDALKKELQERKKEIQELATAKCELSLMLKEAQSAKAHLEKEHTCIQQARESLKAELETCCSEKDQLLRDGLRLQEECQKLKEEVCAVQQSLLLEQEARAKESESASYENSKLLGRAACLEQELEELRASTKELQAENVGLVQEKSTSEQKVAEILKEKELLTAETARLAANIETLRSDFASLSKSKLELQELHSCLSKILDDLRLSHKVALADRAQALQDNSSLLAEKREVALKQDELLKEKEVLAESYFILQKEISQLAKTNSHISANLLESQNENRILRKDKSKLTLKIRELETLHSFTVTGEVPALSTWATNTALTPVSVSLRGGPPHFLRCLYVSSCWLPPKRALLY